MTSSFVYPASRMDLACVMVLPMMAFVARPSVKLRKCRAMSFASVPFAFTLIIVLYTLLFREVQDNSSSLVFLLHC